MFGDEPFLSKVKPDFACRDEGAGQWFDCALKPTKKPGEYIRKNFAAGTYVFLFGVDENKSNPKQMPGDWRANYGFKFVPSKNRQTIDVPITKLIHMVKPQSNDGPLPGSLGENCKEKPLFIPAGYPWTREWTREMTIPFAWEPVTQGANYKIAVVRRHCETYNGQEVFRRFESIDTTYDVTLPPNETDEYYAVFISGFKGGRFVGDFLTYDAGMQSWSYGFRVGPVETPASFYIAAISIVLVLALLWFALGYFGMGLVTRLLVHATLIGILVLVHQMFPNVKAYIPYKYFDLSPVLLANKQPIETNSASARVNKAYPYLWEKEVPKPSWWKSVEPKRDINNYGDLMFWWQGNIQSDKANRKLFKAIYEAIAKHPDDDQLTTTGMSFLFYLTNDLNVLYKVGKVAIQYHLNYEQRIDNCSGCGKGDTIASIANRYAPILERKQGPEKAIAMLEKVIDARGKDMSIYLAAETDSTLIELLHRAKQMRKAREKLDYALTAYTSTNWIGRLKQLDELVPRKSKINRVRLD